MKIPTEDVYSHFILGNTSTIPASLRDIGSGKNAGQSHQAILALWHHWPLLECLTPNAVVSLNRGKVSRLLIQLKGYVADIM